MCQGDSIYDLVDIRDHDIVQNELMSGPPSVSDPKYFPDERVFVCRMNLSRAAKRQLQYHKVRFYITAHLKLTFFFFLASVSRFRTICYSVYH